MMNSSYLDNNSKLSNKFHKMGFVESSRKLWEKGLPSHISLYPPARVPLFIAVGGGKGGVGKSLLSANIAAKLGNLGLRTLIVDLDIGSSNLHTHFGISRPDQTLMDYLIEKKHKFSEILYETYIPNLFLVAGGKDESLADILTSESSAYLELWRALLSTKELLNMDVVLLDLGAGTHRSTIEFFSSVHVGIVTVLPEPTSIENAYSFLKATLSRIIDNSGVRWRSIAAAREINQALASSSYSMEFGFKDQLLTYQKFYPNLVRDVLETIQGRIIGFVVNQIRCQKDIMISDTMSHISDSFFGFESRSFGFMNYDETAWKSLRNQRLLLADFPHSMLAKKIGEITTQLLQCII